jgi:hypothetical protein
MKSVRKNAKPRGLSVEITEDDVVSMLQVSKMRCAVTGIAFSSKEEPDVRGKRKRMWLPSIDRIDSSAGYTKDNVRIVCSAVNVAMSNFGDKLFLRIASAAVSLSITKAVTG